MAIRVICVRAPRGVRGLLRLLARGKQGYAESLLAIFAFVCYAKASKREGVKGCGTSNNLLSIRQKANEPAGSERTLSPVSCAPWQAVKVRILFACLLGVLKKRAFSLRNHPEDFLWREFRYHI